MSTVTKKPYADVYPVAQEIVAKLRPYCDRIEVAGSLRRNRPVVGDIELVALPKMEQRQVDLWGNTFDEYSLLDLFLKDMNVPMTLNGSKMKQFNYDRYRVDLFLPASSEHWGCIYLIRTGSHEFNQWLMSDVQHRTGYRFKDGRLVDRGLPLDTPEEADVLTALGLPFIPPELRDDGLWMGVAGA